jgi:hypothetical protein
MVKGEEISRSFSTGLVGGGRYVRAAMLAALLIYNHLLPRDAIFPILITAIKIGAGTCQKPSTT